MRDPNEKEKKNGARLPLCLPHPIYYTFHACTQCPRPSGFPFHPVASVDSTPRPEPKPTPKYCTRALRNQPGSYFSFFSEAAVSLSIYGRSAKANRQSSLGKMVAKTLISSLSGVISCSQSSSTEALPISSMRLSTAYVWPRQ